MTLRTECDLLKMKLRLEEERLEVEDELGGERRAATAERGGTGPGFWWWAANERVGGRPHCHSQGHLPLPTGDLRGLHSPLVTHQLRLPLMRSYLTNQELNPCPLHWKQSLNHWTTREVPVLVAQSSLTPCHPMDCRLPGFSVHGFL